MPIACLNPKSRSFDNLNAFQNHYIRILHHKCSSEVLNKFSPDGILYENALIHTIKDKLDSLLKEAAQNGAFKVALAMKFMLNEIDTYDADNLLILDKNAVRNAEKAFKNLFAEDEKLNSFEDTYNALRNVSESNLSGLQYDLLARALECGSAKHVKLMMKDLEMDDTQLLAEVKKGLQTYGALLYSISEGNNYMKGELIDILGWENGKNADYLFNILKINFEEDDVRNFELIMKIDYVREAVMDDIENILEATVTFSAGEIFKYFIKHNPDLLKEVHSLGFNRGQVLAQEAVERGSIDILELILEDKNYDLNNQDISGKAHIMVLIDTALEKENSESLELLVPMAEKYLGQSNDNMKPIWQDLMKYAASNNMVDMFHFLNISDVVDMSKDIYFDENSEKNLYISLFARAISTDSHLVFGELLKNTEDNLLAKADAKALIYKNIIEQKAYKSMYMLDDDFINQAMVGIFEKLGTYEHDVNKPTEKVEGYDYVLSDTIKLFNSMMQMKGVGTINEPITEQGETALLLALNLGLVDMSKHIINILKQHEAFEKDSFIAKDLYNDNIILAAVKTGSEDLLAEILCFNGAKEAAGNFNKDGYSPLTQAIAEFAEDSIELVRLLVDRAGLDVDSLDGNMKSALEYALELSDGEETELLTILTDYSNDELDEESSEIFSDEEMNSRRESISSDAASEGSFQDSGNGSDSENESKSKFKQYIHTKSEKGERYNSISSEESIEEVFNPVSANDLWELVWEVSEEEVPVKAGRRNAIKDEEDGGVFITVSSSSDSNLSDFNHSDCEHDGQAGTLFMPRGKYIIDNMAKDYLDIINIVEARSHNDVDTIGNNIFDNSQIDGVVY